MQMVHRQDKGGAAAVEKQINGFHEDAKMLALTKMFDQVRCGESKYRFVHKVGAQLSHMIALCISVRPGPPAPRQRQDRARQVHGQPQPQGLLRRPAWTRAFCNYTSLILVCMENPYKSDT